MSGKCNEGQNESRPWRNSRENCDRPAEPKYGLCARHTKEWQANTGHTDEDMLRAMKSLRRNLGR
jgi:hypothetical protein